MYCLNASTIDIKVPYMRCHRGRRGRDLMVVGFTTYAFSAYHHWCCEFESHRLVVSSTNKLDRHDITEILLKVALNSINLINYGC